jgi:hypothetical protein
MNHKNGKCDSCGRKTTVVVYKQFDTPVLEQCKSCDPKGFEAQARADIDAWLKGGEEFDRSAYGW